MPKSCWGWEDSFVYSVIPLYSSSSQGFESNGVSTGDGSVEEGEAVRSIGEMVGAVDEQMLDDDEAGRCSNSCLTSGFRE